MPTIESENEIVKITRSGNHVDIEIYDKYHGDSMVVTVPLSEFLKAVKSITN